MKEIVVLSGKGGTGKTSIVASFASLAQSKVLADCDVDAADLHLLLKPDVNEEKEFWSGQVAFIDEEKCTECGLCQELCRFEAIYFGGGAHFKNWLSQIEEIYGKENIEIEEIDATGFKCFEESQEKLYRIWVKENAKKSIIK